MLNMLPYILLIAGFAVLIKGADFLVAGATSISRRFNISDLVIGLTAVAFGTSSPELFVNLVAGIKDNTDIAIGNILGSNIANILLILGISSIIHPLSVTKGTVWKEIPFRLMEVIVLGILANDVFLVLGISATVRPLPFQHQYTWDIAAVITATFLLFVCMYTGKKHSLDRWEGAIFILLYMAYITFRVVQALKSHLF